MFDTFAILRAANLRQLAEQAGARFEKMNVRRSKCPLHGGSNETAFEIYNMNGEERWHCHTHCGDGNAIDFVMKWRNCDFVDACKFLGGDDTEISRETIAQQAADKAARAVAEMEAQLAKYQAVLSELRSTQKWLEYHAHLDDNHGEPRELWTMRGVPDFWQEYWQLGYNPMFQVFTRAGKWNTPTLTMPIYGDNREVISIRHRLLNPPSPTDKYRPERAGLKASPFICDLDKGMNFERVLIVEGEIKSMVSYITLDSQAWQVIGIQGKNAFSSLVPALQGKAVWICFDPDAEEQAFDAARQVGGRVILRNEKIDDPILGRYMDTNGLRRLIKYARAI